MIDGAQPLFNMPFSVLQSAPNGVVPITFGMVEGGNLTVTPVSGNIVILGDNWIGGTGPTGHTNDWSVTGNWDANIDPNGATTTVIFGNAGATGTAVLNAGNRSVGSLIFNSATPTTITTTVAYAGILTLDNGSSDATINVFGSGHSIASLVGVRLNNNADITVNAGGSLAVAGNISDGANGHKGITKSGAGTTTLSGANNYGGDTVVTGGKLKVTSASALPDGGNLTVGAAAATMLSSTVGPSEQVAAVITNAADTATSTTPVPQAASDAFGKPSAVFLSTVVEVASVSPAWTTLPKTTPVPTFNAVAVQSPFDNPPTAIGPVLPAVSGVAKAHDAILQAWNMGRPPRNAASLAAAYNLINQIGTKNDSTIGTAVDEAIIRYSK